jgi:hypothetical protein
VLADTTVDVGGFTSLITGVVLNTADTTVHEVVVAAIVDGMVAGERDTIEYRQSEIPPHARAGFSGTSLHPPERILRWTSYPASTVSRPIAGAADEYRASYVRRRLAPRPRLRWPYVDYPDDVGRRSCVNDAPPAVADPWKRVSGSGFTLCLPVAWTDSAGMWRGPAGTITAERVPTALPNDRPSSREDAAYFYSTSREGGLTFRLGRTNGGLLTQATWTGRDLRLSGFAADSAAAALELHIYETVRFVARPK